MQNKNKILIFDTETTGFDDDDRIIQIGSVMISKGRTYTSEQFVRTNRKISIGSMTAHGIRKLPKRVKSIHATETIKRINKLTENDIVIGHNIDFDLHMARFAIKNNKFKIVDTMYIAEFMKKVGILDTKDKINLQYLRYLWITQEEEDKLIKKHKPQGEAHSALFDALITNALAEHMINKLVYEYLGDPTTVWNFVEKLYINRFEPETVTFTFGKYKDKTVREVFNIDIKYLDWFYHNVDGREREKKAIEILDKEFKFKQENK